MNEFQHLSVLISIIVGLGLSFLLASAARLIQMRRRMRPYLPTFVWMAVLFLAQVQIWWATFERRNDKNWNFFTFLLFLLIPVLAALTSYLVVPDLEDEDHVDLRASYQENRAWFFGLFALAPAVSLLEEYLTDYVESGSIHLDVDAYFRVGFFAQAVVAAVVRSERFHLIQSFAALGLFFAYIFTLFLRLV